LLRCGRREEWETAFVVSTPLKAFRSLRLSATNVETRRAGREDSADSW